MTFDRTLLGRVTRMLEGRTKRRDVAGGAQAAVEIPPFSQEGTPFADVER